MTFYLGRPGALQVLPVPIRGREGTWERASTVHETLGGGRMVQFAPGGRRTYGWSWKFLTLDQLSILELFATGGAGPGPYTLIDPERRNMLSVNQSSAGAQLLAGTGMSVYGTGETVGAQTDTPGVGAATFRWSLPTDPAVAGRLTFDPPGAWLAGFPVPPAEAWTFSCLLRGGGADPVLDVTPVLVWLDAAGQAFAETPGATASISDFGWTAASVSRSAPPPGAVMVSIELRVAAGSFAAAASGLGQTALGTRRWATWRALTPWPGPGRQLQVADTDWMFGSSADVLIDRPMLDMWPTVRPWVLGTGMPQVSWLALPDSYNLINAHNPSATLVEVG